MTMKWQLKCKHYLINVSLISLSFYFTMFDLDTEQELYYNFKLNLNVEFKVKLEHWVHTI